MTDGELDALKLVWLEQRQSLSAGSEMKEFYNRLEREWAIETGLIERVYELDRGTTQTLIDHGIQAALIPQASGGKSPELVAELFKIMWMCLKGCSRSSKAKGLSRPVTFGSFTLRFCETRTPSRLSIS